MPNPPLTHYKCIRHKNGITTYYDEQPFNDSHRQGFETYFGNRPFDNLAKHQLINMWNKQFPSTHLLYTV